MASVVHPLCSIGWKAAAVAYLVIKTRTDAVEFLPPNDALAPPKSHPGES